MSLSSLHNVFPSGVAVASKLVAAAMLQSLDTIFMKASSFERSKVGLSLGKGRARVGDDREYIRSSTLSVWFTSHSGLPLCVLIR